MSNNRAEQIEYIYEKIANKELVIGCEYQWGDKMYPRSNIITENSQDDCGCTKRNSNGGMILAGSAFTDWKCITCKKTFSHNNTRTPKRCMNCVIKTDKCPRCGKYFKIKGLPIHIGNVLSYLENKGLDLLSSEILETIFILWKDKNKSLDYQGIELLEYIYNLIIEIENL